nr:hypothetical protein [Candidatus Sigynarchaeota archaeon]
MDKNVVLELDQLAKLLGVDRATVVRKIIEEGMPRTRLEIGITLYQKGETMERAAEISGTSIWDLVEEAHLRRITRLFDIEQEKQLFTRVLGKDDSKLKEKILRL